MPTQLNPYLSFGDNAREAMTYYQEIFGGELLISTYGEYGDASAPGADLVMHANLTTPDGLCLMGADTPPGMNHTPANGAITVSLNGGDPALATWFEKLAEGGSVTMPMEKQMWGDTFGMCTDRFGIPWMVNLTAGE